MSGLIRNRGFPDLTHTEIINALRINGWVGHSDDRRKYDVEGVHVGELTHKSGGRVHFVQSLVTRAPTVGIRTLGQFAAAVRNGYTAVGDGDRFQRHIPSGNACVVFQPDRGWRITFTYA